MNDKLVVSKITYEIRHATYRENPDAFSYLKKGPIWRLYGYDADDRHSTYNEIPIEEFERDYWIIKEL